MKKVYYSGAEVLGFYIRHLDGSVSDNHGNYYSSFEAASFYCGLGDKVYPKFYEV